VVDEVALIHELGRLAEQVVHHPKLVGVTPAAAWMWLRGIVLARNGTPKGVISADAVRRLKPGTVVPQLVAAGLWKPVPGGWTMRSLDARPLPPQTAPVAVQPAGPALLSFPVVGMGAGTWTLTQQHVDAWRVAYPAVDVLGECRKALVWVEADLKRRKTAQGMSKFLVTWLSRTNDRPRGEMSAVRGRTGAPPPGKYEGS
jgi:hypothetical protein